ncbi:ABC transporter ATP-binding protein [Lactobacillus johnsonii]|uniref:ABC transporter ATP-binding protein n=1 Tax=Lactobacillus johnsonii TaxID=33959 RepID=UPI00201AD7C5|nr:ABC transporter ATP-binding protein [Lactobacillus johnsonii]MCL5442803.1 ABC transporter ATP-binding protein [Lactobacillus johnsonii]MDT9606366.1 ABC transporter ATP-binding protein [Lactobacillus johnsonii]
MANLQVKDLVKSYDGKNKVLKDISFTVENGELVSILGPSGCGKTTTLRIIAGLISATEGQILVDQKDISKVPVYKRNFGMVFQSYALFPHMTVFNNVAFGLKMKKISKKDIKQKVDEILEITGLSQLASRYPKELSGGQQQRVSLARALVVHPQLLFMDEPLSNLDAKLRIKMRGEIRDLQKKLNMTVLFVTHDQKECFAISDKVLIMKDGRIEQYDTPENIFHHPSSEYVARFIGYENFINVDHILDDHTVESKDLLFITDESTNQAKTLTIRPENIQINSSDNSSQNLIDGIITSSEYLGQSFKYRVKTSLGNFIVEESRKAMRSSEDKVQLYLPSKHLHPLSR